MLSSLLNIVLRVRNRHILLLDVLIFACAPFLALALRLDAGIVIEHHGLPVLLLGAVMVVVGVPTFWYHKLYRRLWRYASVDETIRIALAGLTAGLVLIGVFFLILRPYGLIPADFPRSIPFLTPLVYFPLVATSRLSPRVAQRIHERFQSRTERRRAIVAGAGEAGVMIVRELQANPSTEISPVALIDDDASKQGLRIRGLQVEGTTGQIKAVARKHAAGLLVIAMPTATGDIIRRITESGIDAGLEVRVIPGVFELVNGTVEVKQLRSVQVEDLLRRVPVDVDRTRIDRILSGKRVLVTGAGGSIGSELSRQILAANPAAMLLVGHGENSIFSIDRILQARVARNAGSTVVESAIADIRDIARMERLFERFKPDLVFHAAAHKHVPLMESNPEEAITNNVLGTRVLTDLAARFGVERFLMISTDKAVNPTSVMGGAKRVAEMLVYAEADRSGRPFMAVRFGNVLGSRGSVLETFRAQISAGGPLTVTHPEMKRYFMTIPEAVQLTLQACALGTGGEVFVLDMGEPVRIVDLARDVIRLSGLKLDQDIRIDFTGLRPGEKLFEELFLKNEEYERTEHESIFVCRSAMLATQAIESAPDFRQMVDRLVECATEGDQVGLVALLQDLVPEYSAGSGPRVERIQAHAPSADAEALC